MKPGWYCALACSALVNAAAAPGDFRLEVDSARPADSEDTALMGYALLQPNAANSRAVGTVGRAYSLSRQPGNTVWGVVTEAINFASAQGNVVGTESAVVNQAHDNVGELRGIDVVFKNRMDSQVGSAMEPGANRYNESTAAVFISSQPRSPGGEYAGWQSGIKFGRSSVDRSITRAWAAAIDVSDVEVDAPFYLVVWRCGAQRCGLKLTEAGALIVRDIDGAMLAGNGFAR
jgi:hypothetical protein